MKVLTFGEVMLRLKTPGVERFMQSPSFEAVFGGGEANVAVSLANFGMDAAFCTILPKQDIADACLRELRGFGVDVSRVVRKEGRMGLYFLEMGVNHRPSKVIYDRQYSAFSLAKSGDLDWAQTFKGVHWFHITGISPALSETARDLSLQAVSEAKMRGITLSCDVNYRANLWKYGDAAPDVMRKMVSYADVLITNEADLQYALSIREDMPRETEKEEYYQRLGQRVFCDFPDLKLLAIPMRRSLSVDEYEYGACLSDGEHFWQSPFYSIRDTFERVGGGDAFSAGLIYGLNRYHKKQEALNFAVAASCLKHSIPGDFCRMTVPEVEALMQGTSDAKVQR